MSTQPAPPSTPAPGGGGGRGGLIIGVVAIVAVVAGVVIFTSRQPAAPGPISGGPTSGGPNASTVPTGAFDSTGRPEPTFTPLENVESTSPLFWVDVRDPKATHGVLQKNGWIDRATKDPLGQGFLAAWSGFFGTRGQDIGGSFKGTVTELFLSEILDQPYRVMWFGGQGVKGAPALVIPTPSASAKTAFQTLIKIAGSGGFQPPGCSGGSVTETDGGASETSIHRVVLADKTLFVTSLPDRLVLSTGPQAVQAASCEELPKPAAKQGIAFTLGFALKEGGRGTQSLADLVGLEPNVGLDFAVEGDHFAPKGVDAATNRDVLATIAPSETLLKAVPENAGVVLYLAVKLPETLNATSLRDTLAAEDENFGGTKKKWPLGAPRQVALVWNPRAEGMELAVLWEKTSDEKVIAEGLLKGSGALKSVQGCPVIAFATEAMRPTIDATCKGKRPSVLQSAPAVVQGLKQATAVSFTVNLGKVLSQLTLDGFASENGGIAKVPTGPQEIEAARRLLEELPTVGFTGGPGANNTWLSGGFRS